MWWLFHQASIIPCCVPTGMRLPFSGRPFGGLTWEGGEPFGGGNFLLPLQRRSGSAQAEGRGVFTCAVPPQLKTPFGQHYGYLTKEDAVEAHSHQEEEMYLILRGKGMITVGEETAEVTGGDVVAVAPDLLPLPDSRRRGTALGVVPLESKPITKTQAGAG